MIDFFAKSAVFSLLLTVGFFVIKQIQQTQQQQKQIEQLKDIKDALSTRSLGIFPSYIADINQLMSVSAPTDSVVIFEDVLYYGFISKPEEFKKLNHSLVARADAGSDITIAYYDVEGGGAFDMMLIDQLIGKRELGILRDSSKREKAFQEKRERNLKAFEAKINKYLAQLQDKQYLADSVSVELEEMYGRMDSVKTSCVGKKNKRDITYSDYRRMYQDISREMIRTFTTHGIKMVPLKDYLTMSCWMVGHKAVIAFPSKYSTDEIGFISQDEAFHKYIKKMLEGVQNANLEIERRSAD